MSHRCHAERCEEQVHPSMLMCRRHWYMVPQRLRGEVWRTYRAGQERTKDPSDAYLAAHHDAVAAVAELEGLGREAAEHRRLAESYRDPGPPPPEAA